jgi:hypothetical protein
MRHTHRLTLAAASAVVLALFVTSAAFAHACYPADKPSGAGSIGVFNIATGTFTPGKNNPGNFNNGGFVTFTDGANFAYDLFLHQYLPAGALAAGPEGDNVCDGRGVDEALTCLGIPH